ncbi:TIGR03545 family protein [Candidatus Ruminimicrobiellum ovillum]|uniref:TIGR03545 family protein n=1 Tax=Candidatus Ruminimicrobiellum ovillum TaxID=1947927 RepID=UPI00355A8127
MKIIRWSFLLTTIIIIALIAILNILFFDKILKKVIISTGQTIVGAKVEIDYLKTSFKNCSVTINGFRAADKNNYFKNLVDIEKVRFDVRFAPLLRKKVVIDEMSLDGLRWQTDRKTSGELPKKKKSNKESKFAKMFKTAKDKTVTEFNNLPSVEMFNKIQDQIKNFDVNKLIEDSGLSSIKEVEKVSADLQNKYKSYQDKINNFNYEEKINRAKALAEDLSKSKFGSLADIANTAKKVNELKTLKKEFDDILVELNNAKKDVSATIDVTKQIKNTITNDVNMICEKISIPTLNTKNISQMLFGTKWVNRVEKVLYYISIIKQYIPEGSDEEEVKEVKQRALGRDILFREKLYPSLLISLMKVTGTTAKTKEETGIDFSGLIKNISSSPKLVGAPVILELAGNNATQKLAVNGLFDHRTKDSKDNIKVEMEGLSGTILNIEPNDYLPLIDTSKVNVAGSFDLNNSGFLCSADIAFRDIKEKALNSVEGNLKYLAQITNSIKSFDVNLTAQTQDSENLNIKINSDIDKKLYDAISKLFSAKVNEAKDKIKQKVNELAQEKAKEIEKNLQGQKDAVLKQINEKIGVVNNIESIIGDVLKKQK